MGYTTDFTGIFKLNRKLDKATHDFLNKFNETRRMARDSAKLQAKFGRDFGVEGEFFVDASGSFGQDRDDTITEYNNPPKTQPSLWCQWRPTDNGMGIEWDGGEKFYEYVEWVEYLIKSVLAPKGYVLNGAVQWRGEDFNDLGTILVVDNVVSCKHGKHVNAPKAKAKPIERVVIKSRRIDGMTYFRMDTLIETLHMAKQLDSEHAISAVIRELERIGNK